MDEKTYLERCREIEVEIRQSALEKREERAKALYPEAIEDGVLVDLDAPIDQMFLIPCQECGRRICRSQYSRKRIYICNYCKGLIREKEKAISELEGLEDIETKKDKQFFRAVDKLEKQVKDFSKYEKAIKVAKTRTEKYDSIPEVMVAIELLKLGYKIIPQQKIKRYRVDFAIPKEKIVIEVDGKIFHKDKYKGNREGIIQLSLGLDWKIIHIPAELIAKDITKLSEIIKTYK